MNKQPLGFSVSFYFLFIVTLLFVSVFSNLEFKCFQQWKIIFVCFQFEQAADGELSWLTEAEGKLLSMGEIRLEQDQTTAQLQAQKVSLSHCVCVYG